MAGVKLAEVTSSSRLLDEVFGADSKGTSPEERARTSRHVFVRSQHQLTLYAEGAQGRQLNAFEALQTFGWDKLSSLSDRQAVAIIQNSREPYDTIRHRIDTLNLELPLIAKKAGWTDKTLKLFLEQKQVPFRYLERIAQLLALDERILGKPGAKADDALGVRLRELRGGDAMHFTPSVVLGLAEAAWVVRRQLELASTIGTSQPEHLGKLGFTPDANYGSAMRPAWRVGYELAQKTRRLLGISDSAPIESLKELIEGQLKIPVVQLDLPPHFAGATIANGDSRGIVVNLQGLNENIWVRRMTLAHELGHLLWDSDDKLRKLIVDQYSDVNSTVQKARDFVEMRANGFAIEFLAPQHAIRDEFENAHNKTEGITTIMSRYGISKTAAVYHIENAYHGEKDLSVAARQANVDPESDWIGREEMAVPYFTPQSVPISRRGYFAGYVAEATEREFISKDSAAALLACEPENIDVALKSIHQLILQ